MFSVRSLTPNLGAEMSGVSVAEIDETAFRELYRAFLRYQVLVFRPSGRHPDKGTLAWHTDGS